MVRKCDLAVYNKRPPVLAAPLAFSTQCPSASASAVSCFLAQNFWFHSHSNFQYILFRSFPHFTFTLALISIRHSVTYALPFSPFTFRFDCLQKSPVFSHSYHLFSLFRVSPSNVFLREIWDSREKSCLRCFDGGRISSLSFRAPELPQTAPIMRLIRPKPPQREA